MPPKRLALDDGRLQAQLGGADGGDIAAGAGTDDDQIELSHARISLSSAS
jgi:hypothetical protein